MQEDKNIKCQGCGDFLFERCSYKCTCCTYPKEVYENIDNDKLKDTLIDRVQQLLQLYSQYMCIQLDKKE